MSFFGNSKSLISSSIPKLNLSSSNGNSGKTTISSGGGKNNVFALLLILLFSSIYLLIYTNKKFIKIKDDIDNLVSYKSTLDDRFSEISVTFNDHRSKILSNNSDIERMKMYINSITSIRTEIENLKKQIISINSEIDKNNEKFTLIDSLNITIESMRNDIDFLKKENDLMKIQLEKNSENNANHQPFLPLLS